MKLDSLEEQFRSLQSQLIEDYEEEVERNRRRKEEAQRRSRQRMKQRAEVLAECGVDLEQLRALEEQFAEEDQERIAGIREGLINRERSVADSERAVDQEIANEACDTVVSPYAATLLAPDAESLEDVEGKQGNPWAQPYNPQTINIANSDSGGGGDWGAGLTVDFPPPRP